MILTEAGYPSERGAADDDRMAYHPAYANFNMKARDGRPDILYQVSVL